MVSVHLRSVDDRYPTYPGPEEAAELLVLIDRGLRVRDQARGAGGHQLFKLVSPAGHLLLSPGLVPPVLSPPVSLHLEEVEGAPPSHHVNDPAVPPLVRSAQQHRQQSPVGDGNQSS